jgi:hypothetical protein
MAQVFDPDLVPALVAVLRFALQQGRRPSYALIALTVRNPTTMQKFVDAVKSMLYDRLRSLLMANNLL